MKSTTNCFFVPISDRVDFCFSPDKLFVTFSCREVNHMSSCLGSDCCSCLLTTQLKSIQSKSTTESKIWSRHRMNYCWKLTPAQSKSNIAIQITNYFKCVTGVLLPLIGHAPAIETEKTTMSYRPAFVFHFERYSNLLSTSKWSRGLNLLLVKQTVKCNSKPHLQLWCMISTAAKSFSYCSHQTRLTSASHRINY